MLHPADLSISNFSYDLPQARIAQHPLAQRDQSKLLQYQQSVISDHRFTDLPNLLPSDALLLFNNTRVVQARLLFRKESGGLIELFCLEPILPSPEVQTAMQATTEAEWLCLVGNNKRWKSGMLQMEHEGMLLQAERVAAQGEGYRIRFSWSPADRSFAEILQAFGNIPLPPYLQREAEADDSKRYQTVYARFDGAVAAPTAGLHFTQAVFDGLQTKGIGRQELTLHVGAGTFKPVKAETMAGHEMHREEIVVTKSLLQRLLTHQGPIIPVGTTSLRTLESLYWMGCMLQPSDARLPEPGQFTAYELAAALSTEEALARLLQWLEARQLEQVIAYTAIMIAPGYRFKLAKALITNFHQPQSTLLLLIAAAVGEQWKRIYEHALQHDYRFLSYGDSSLLWFEQAAK
ncbi:MAG: S-adenosylmethionine:tRNA ribosyltransferase-isomerase [Sphingobacteriaceae bacterium]|nr:S-adenosylmethionine:tRNA ribosyltransferase-isomerase [Sphingobacteriaceae bacterium]